MIEDEVPIRKEALSFVISLIKYSLLKITSVVKFFARGALSVNYFFSRFKQRAVLRLVWKRGALVRPASHVGFIFLSSIVLISGSFLGSAQVLGNENEVFEKEVRPVFQKEAILMESNASQTKIPEGRGRDRIVNYRVKEGDTLSLIAEEYNISVDTLTYVNDLNDTSVLAVGTELVILPVTGIDYEVKSGDTVESVAQDYKTDAQAIIEINWLDKPYTLEVGQNLILPNAEAPKPPAPVYTALAQESQGSQQLAASSSQPVSGSGQFVWPTAGFMTRGYGWFYGYWHGAIDLANNGCGGAVVAGDSGYVEVSGWREGGYGLTVWINHGNGYYSRYAHLSATSVSAGSYVQKGQQIGAVGATGLAFGCHLHFVVERNGVAIDPLSVL